MAAPPPEENPSFFGSIQRVAQSAVNGARGLASSATKVVNGATGVVKGAVNGATSVAANVKNRFRGAVGKVTGTITGGRRCSRRHRHTRRCRKRLTRRNKRHRDFSRI
jgi:hypothetical protein